MPHQRRGRTASDRETPLLTGLNARQWPDDHRCDLADLGTWLAQ